MCVYFWWGRSNHHETLVVDAHENRILIDDGETEFLITTIPGKSVLYQCIKSREGVCNFWVYALACEGESNTSCVTETIANIELNQGKESVLVNTDRKFLQCYYKKESGR